MMTFYRNVTLQTPPGLSLNAFSGAKPPCGVDALQLLCHPWGTPALGSL